MAVGVTATVLMVISTPAFAAPDAGLGGAPATSSGAGAAGLLWLVAGLLALTVGFVLATRPRRGPAPDALPASPAPEGANPRPDGRPSADITNSNSHDKPNGARK